MSAYVLTKKNRNGWDLPVFYARRSGDKDAFAVFTGRRAAESYLSDTGRDPSLEVHQVTAVELFDLIVSAHHEGVSYVVVDPVRKRQKAGEDQPVIVVEQQIAHFAEQLTREVMAKRLEAAAAPSEPTPVLRKPY